MKANKKKNTLHLTWALRITVHTDDDFFQTLRNLTVAIYIIYVIAHKPVAQQKKHCKQTRKCGYICQRRKWKGER